MKTVLFIASATRLSCQTRIGGVQRFFRGTDTHVQIIERNRQPIDIGRILDFWKPVGVIAECGSVARELAPANMGRTPTVYLDAEPNLWKGTRYTVNADVAASARLAARTLLSIGLSHYAFVGYGDLYWSRMRERIFADLIRLNGCGCACFRDTGKGGVAKTRRLTAWLKALPKPCGLFAAIDTVAEEILEACEQAGIRVPDELAVLGVDNISDVCDNTSPTLSSIAVDFELAGYLSAELLQAVITRSAGRTRHLTYGLIGVVNRQSTRRCGHLDSRVAQALEFIRVHACAGIGVRDVLPLFGCCRRLAEQRFRKITGRTLYGEIRAVRLRHATDLLRAGDRAITDIAGLCGYKSDSTLRYAFGASDGLSPRQIRMRAKAMPGQG